MQDPRITAVEQLAEKQIVVPKNTSYQEIQNGVLDAEYGIIIPGAVRIQDASILAYAKASYEGKMKATALNALLDMRENFKNRWPSCDLSNFFTHGEAAATRFAELAQSAVLGEFSKYLPDLNSASELLPAVGLHFVSLTHFVEVNGSGAVGSSSFSVSFGEFSCIGDELITKIIVSEKTYD